MNPKWNKELKKLKKEAHWYVDNVFPTRADAYLFARTHTGKCHIGQMNEHELNILIKKMKKRGLRKLHEEIGRR